MPRKAQGLSAAQVQKAMPGRYGDGAGLYLLVRSANARFWIFRYVRAGKMRIEYLSFETATQAPKVFETQQIAVYAAGKQEKAWYFIQLFYSEQGERDSGYVTESYLLGLAKQVPGLNLAKWTAERSDPELAAEVEMDARAGNAAGFTGTASFLLGKTGGTFKPFAPGEYTELAPYESAIESLLKS